MKKAVWLSFPRLVRAVSTAALAAGLFGAAALSAPVTVGAAEGEGPCDKYAAALCEKAGPTSCPSIELAVGLMPPKACEAGLADLNYSEGKIAELKKKCDELGNRLCKDLGEETETCKLVRSKVPELAPEQCQGMLEQYAQVLADLQRQEQANQPLSADDQKAVASGTPAMFGDASAKVTVVEFSDFECPYCTRAAEVANQIKTNYPKNVRFVFRQFPLSFHQNAHLAAQASLAAAAEGKFWEYHDLLFENQKSLGRESLEKYAEQIGLDMKAFKKALDEGTYKEAVDNDIELGNKVAVSGTPTMFINGKRVANATDYNSVSQQIDAALAGN